MWGYQAEGDRQLLKRIVRCVRRKIERDPASRRVNGAVGGATRGGSRYISNTS
jgi:hypothetical protein